VITFSETDDDPVETMPKRRNICNRKRAWIEEFRAECLLLTYRRVRTRRKNVASH
jgi:hypothetical protein